MFKQESFDFSRPPVSISYEHLVRYGIFEENSDVRAHVGPIARCVYVYKTREMIEDITNNEYKIVPARQEGVDVVTAEGFLVPFDRPFIRPIRWHSTPWWEVFCITESTTKKGRKAVNVVKEIMRNGRFPFWVIPTEADISLDVNGTDIIVSGRWKTQVKCDFTAGPRKLKGCSGNLYVQIAECNPKKRY